MSIAKLFIFVNVWIALFVQILCLARTSLRIIITIDAKDIVFGFRPPSIREKLASALPNFA